MNARARPRPFGLLVWVAAACALLWFAPRPPDPPPTTPEEEASRARATSLVVRDVREWTEEYGDRSIEWADATGHMAIVIDDVGRELHVFEKLLSLRHRLTFSVLPGARYAAGVQLRLGEDRRRYREVLLHVPMEPLDPGQMQEGDESVETFLLRTDGPDRLRTKLQEALGRVPMAVGVNNHMGSALTPSREAMDALMPVLSERGLFFLDSRTTAQTQAEAAAQVAGVPVVARSVFLDNEVTEASIARELERAAQMSVDGPVVAIGHPSVELHAVLQRELDALHERGISVYPLSHLVAHAAR